MRIGDVVRLKSGGPEMTIQEVNEDHDISCCWFLKSGEVTAYSFDVRILDVVRPRPTRRPTKLLVTERDSDLEAAKHELDEYLNKGKRPA